ncbi:MAG: hypothetical protein HYX72_05870 [Acidobacteria bacterium]|nr:hypothetical protein [Acidobacteriota bacterium]
MQKDVISQYAPLLVYIGAIWWGLEMTMRPEKQMGVDRFPWNKFSRNGTILFGAAMLLFGVFELIRHVS